MIVLRTACQCIVVSVSNDHADTSVYFISLPTKIMNIYPTKITSSTVMLGIVPLSPSPSLSLPLPPSLSLSLPLSPPISPSLFGRKLPPIPKPCFSTRLTYKLNGKFVRTKESKETATAFTVTQTSHNSRKKLNPRIKIQENVPIETVSFCRIVPVEELQLEQTHMHSQLYRILTPRGIII